MPHECPECMGDCDCRAGEIRVGNCEHDCDDAGDDDVDDFEEEDAY